MPAVFDFDIPDMEKMMQNRRKRKRVILALLLAAVAGITGWMIWSNVSLQVSRYTVQAHHLPKAFDGFTIAQISDLHNAEFGKDNEKLIDILQDEKPDIIAITGDLIDSDHTDIEAALSFVRQATEIAPCYYVTGNHEAWSGTQYEELKAGLQALGVFVLEDEAAVLEYHGAAVSVIGLNDPDFSERDNALAGSILNTKLTELHTQDRFTILLSHRPEHFEVYRDHNVGLVLSGHAHGGQFRLPLVGGVIAPDQSFFPEYDAGLYTDGDTAMIVSRGLGNSILPVRFCNRPEIVMIELINSAE